MEQFSTGAALSAGWQTFKKRPGFLIGATFVALVIMLILRGVSYGVSPQPLEMGFFGSVTSIIALLLTVLVDMGLTALALKAHDDVEKVSFSDLSHPHPYWSYLLATIATAIIVVIGFFLIIIPGIIAALALLFVKFIVIDRNTPGFDALRESVRITHGHRWDLLGLFLAVLGINILGVLCLGIGLLVSIPVTSIAVAHAYRMLSAQAGDAPASAVA